MKRKISIITMVTFLMFFGAGLRGQASALTLPDPESFLDSPTDNVLAALPYGDFYSYSLPVLQYFSEDKKEYSVKSTPGAIKDGIVIYTGSKGQPVTTNDGIMDGAYPTPSGTYTSFSTTTVADPNPTGGWDTDLTWDTTLSALDSYLGDDDLYFFFNHNQDNKLDDQSLYAWGRMAIVDTDGSPIEATKYYYFDNGLSKYEPDDDDYVYSPGELNLYGDGSVFINHNLGADEAAFAICLSDGDATVESWLATGYDAMQIEFRLKALSDGFEQLFILKLEDTTPIPEPATLFLLGTGLIGIGAFGRKKFKKFKSLDI